MILIFACLIVLVFVTIASIHYFYKKYLNEKLKGKHVLYFHSGGEYSQPFAILLNFIIEKIIFLRIDLFKNYPRGNFLWVKTVAHVTILYCIAGMVLYSNLSSESFKSCFNGINPAVVLGTYFTLISTFYWSEKSKLKDKWQYLATMYNQILLNWNDPVKHQLLSNALAIDTVVTMMWGHRSFSSIVYSELKVAILAESDKDRERYLSKFANNLLQESEVIKILENHQLRLMGDNPPGK